MRGWALPLAVATAAFIVYWSAAELPAAARLWTTLLLTALPPLMVAQAAQLRNLRELPRVAGYLSTIGSLWVLAAITLAVAFLSGFTASDLGFVSLPTLTTVIWTAGITAAGVAVLFGFHFAGFRDPPLVEQLMPVTRQERVLFVGVSATAGICEEIIFRGFLIHALLIATESVTLTLLLTAGVFGIVHAYQHSLGALRAALLGALLALPVLVHGSIYPAILAHTLIDLLSGFWLARFLLR